VYKVKLRSVRATIVVVEKQRVLHKLSVFICSLRYPACNEHVTYGHLWPGPNAHAPYYIVICGLAPMRMRRIILSSVAWPALQYFFTISHKGPALAQWLRYCATNQKVAGSIPDGVMEFFIDIILTMALGSTQPLTEMNTRRIFWG
jgi:hypothetical protein